jgi:hypothetical protein
MPLWRGGMQAMHEKIGTFAGYSIIGLGLVIEAIEHVEFIWSHVPKRLADMIDQKAVFLLLLVGFAVLFLRKREKALPKETPPTAAQTRAEANSGNATATGGSATIGPINFYSPPSPAPALPAPKEGPRLPVLEFLNSKNMVVPPGMLRIADAGSTVLMGEFHNPLRGINQRTPTACNVEMGLVPGHTLIR